MCLSAVIKLGFPTTGQLSLAVRNGEGALSPGPSIPHPLSRTHSVLLLTPLGAVDESTTRGESTRKMRALIFVTFNLFLIIVQIALKLCLLPSQITDSFAIKSHGADTESTHIFLMIIELFIKTNL